MLLLVALLYQAVVYFGRITHCMDVIKFLSLLGALLEFLYGIGFLIHITPPEKLLSVIRNLAEWY